jgi:hypothetical protein
MKHNFSSAKKAILLIGFIGFLIGCQDMKYDIIKQSSDISSRIGNGWYKIEQSATDQDYRWMGQEAEIIIEPKSSIRAKITISISSFYKTRICNIILGDKIIANTHVPQEKETVLDFQADLTKGPNILRIVSPDPSQAPAEIPELKNPDTRKLSFVVSAISIKPLS